MKQEVVQSKLSNVDEAVKELCSKLRQNKSSYNAILFFASSNYDFEQMSTQIKSAFENAEVIGCTTSGEVCNEGFFDNSVVLTALSCSKTKFKGVLIDDADKFPMVEKYEIERAASQIGISFNSSFSGNDSFALTFICGLRNAEESTMTLLNTIIGNSNFLIAGGSAGDDLKFKTTFVSYNGVCSSSGAVVLFVKTECKFDIRKENIFQSTGKSVSLTKVVPEKRLILLMDGKNPRKRYAELVGVRESEVEKALLSHPLGRVFGDNTFISSIASFNSDGTINMYSRVLQDSVLEILEPIDAIAEAKKTCEVIKQKIPNPGCVLFINCILRTIGFKQQQLTESITRVWSSNFSTYCGFSSYGEQIGHVNSNQTLVSVVIGE